MSEKIDDDRFPEWRPFLDAVQLRRARVLGAHLEGQPVGTRGFEEREPPLRALNDADLMTALHDRMATLNAVAAAADEIPADTDVAWTGRTMKAPWFAEHMREELSLHGWGAKQLRAGERIEARLRVPDTDDVLLNADPDAATIAFADPEGPATLETDALDLWSPSIAARSRRPADPAREPRRTPNPGPRARATQRLLSCL